MGEFVSFCDPECYAGGSVATGRVTEEDSLGKVAIVPQREGRGNSSGFANVPREAHPANKPWSARMEAGYEAGLILEK